MHGLFTYGVGLVLARTAGTDSNLRRCPSIQAWIDLRKEFTPAGVLGGIRPVTSAMTYDAAIARIAGLYATAAASMGSLTTTNVRVAQPMMRPFTTDLKSRFRPSSNRSATIESGD